MSASAYACLPLATHTLSRPQNYSPATAAATAAPAASFSPANQKLPLRYSSHCEPANRLSLPRPSLPSPWYPPSTGRSVAVINDASSLNRKRIAAATSQGSPQRSSMWNCPQIGSHVSRSPCAARSTSRVQIQPGLTLFTRIPYAAKSRAMHFVNIWTAPFAELYVHLCLCATKAEMLDRKSTRLNSSHL